jgi:uncharacterized membrane protein (UPF0127 family)
MMKLGVLMSVTCGYAFNRTRRQYLATRLSVADTHWSRLLGLMGKTASDFQQESGLWIVPCRGVHTLGMRFPIDVLYLDRDRVVVHLEPGLQPWRLAPVRLKAASVLELPENMIRSTGTTIGDQLEIDTRSAEERAPA